MTVGSAAVAAQRLPRRAIGLAGGRELLRGLQRGQRVREVRAGLAVDLPWRESLAIEQDLEADQIAALQRRGRRGAALGADGFFAALRSGRCWTGRGAVIATAKLDSAFGICSQKAGSRALDG